MAKFDVETAYRNISVHPEDRYLLWMKWRGQFVVDLALPLGLRSAPCIFNAVTDMVEWIILNKYSVLDLLHYLDDLITTELGSVHQELADLVTCLSVARFAATSKQVYWPIHPFSSAGNPTRFT